jgi:hypothetical protein
VTLPTDVEIEQLAWMLLDLRGTFTSTPSLSETWSPLHMRSVPIISLLNSTYPKHYHDSFVAIEGGDMKGGKWLIVDNVSFRTEHPWVLRVEIGRHTQYDPERGPETLEWLRKLLPLESLVI